MSATVTMAGPSVGLTKGCSEPGAAGRGDGRRESTREKREAMSVVEMQEAGEVKGCSQGQQVWSALIRETPQAMSSSDLDEYA